MGSRTDCGGSLAEPYLIFTLSTAARYIFLWFQYCKGYGWEGGHLVSGSFSLSLYFSLILLSVYPSSSAPPIFSLVSNFPIILATEDDMQIHSEMERPTDFFMKTLFSRNQTNRYSMIVDFIIKLVVKLNETT